MRSSLHATCAVPIALAVLVLGVLTLEKPVCAQPSLPAFENVSLRVVVSLDQTTGEFSYTYTAANPVTNTVGITRLVVETQDSFGAVPCLVAGPPDWYRTRAARATFAAWSAKSRAAEIAPGQMRTGWGLRVVKPPALRRASAKADIITFLEEHDIDLDIAEVFDLHERYTLSLKTLGPLGVPVGTFEHWNTFESDLAQTAELGWITDGALLASLRTSLQAARQAVLARNGPQAIAHLQAMVGAIEGSTESQRTSEGYALVKYNAEYLRDHLPIPVSQ